MIILRVKTQAWKADEIGLLARFTAGSARWHRRGSKALVEHRKSLATFVCHFSNVYREHGTATQTSVIMSILAKIAEIENEVIVEGNVALAESTESRCR